MGRKTKKKHINKFKTTGTQTEDTQTNLQEVTKDVVVKIKRLNENELQKLLIKQRKTIHHPRQSLSRLPSNYSNFVRPINNNEVANSTLANLTEEQQTASSNTEENADLDMARFIKPGPKSYKMKMFRKIQSLRAPVALSTPKCAKETNKTLTILSEREVTSPVLPQIVSVDVHEVPQNNRSEMEVCDGVTEAEQSANCNISVISTGEVTKNNANVDDVKQTKYIRITAETVHIHNHFYKV